jgi:hypothetical protein
MGWVWSERDEGGGCGCWKNGDGTAIQKKFTTECGEHSTTYGDEVEYNA